MDKQFSSSYLDAYLVEHHYKDYSSIVFAKGPYILYEKYAESFNANTNQDTSFLIPGIISLLTGIAIDRHYLKSLEVPIRTILPEFDMGRDHLHRIIKIKHLLSMTSGLLWSSSKHWIRPIYYDLLYKENTSDVLSELLVSNVPGMQYCYKEWDYILLAVILEKVLKVSLDEFCCEVLFDPLDIYLSKDDFNLSSKSIIHNLYADQHNFSSSVNDIHKLSQMLLNNGVYKKKKILSLGYVRDMQQPQEANNSYGYMWTLFPFGYGIIGKCNQKLILNPKLNISYLLLLKDDHNNIEYRGIYAKLLENMFEQ